ncbi:MAG: hypothetical protein AAGA96_19520 [Verrucomicrobiota bacterium]
MNPSYSSLAATVSLALVGLVSPALANDSIEIDLAAQKIGPQVELIEKDTETILRVAVSEPSKKPIRLFIFQDPPITGEAYAIQGEVLYHSVEGEGYLEMWNHLPVSAGSTEVGSSFFSRTLAYSGPMQKLSGESDWRYFQLPGIVNDGSGRTPLRLTLNLVLPETGTVELKNLTVIPDLPIPKMSSATGILATILPVFAVIIVITTLAIVVLVLFLKRRKTQEELDRIRTIDGVS